MRERGDQSTNYDWAGHFVEPDQERAYRLATWRSDRANLERVGWIAGFVILASFVIDYNYLGLSFPILVLDFALRAVTSAWVFGYTVAVRRASLHPRWDQLSFATEIIILSFLFGMQISLASQVVDQAAVLIAISIFLWFYVPIHSKYAIAASIYMIGGQLALNATIINVGNAESAMTYVLMLMLMGMGFLSKRASEKLRRENFSHDQRLIETNEALRREVETRAKAEVREASARERFELLFRVSPIPLALTKHKGGIVIQANDASLALIGCQESDVVGKSIGTYVRHTPPLADYLASVDASREIVSGEIQIDSVSGGVRDCVATSMRFMMEDEECVVTGLYDITHRKEHERDLVDAKDRAESAQKSQAAFLSTMSHELRTPLNALLGFMQIIEMDEIPEESKQHLTLARQSGEHILQLISDILDLSKLSAGKLTIQPVETDCRALAQKALDTFKLAAAEKGITLRLDVDDDQFVSYVDDIRTRQILLNLIGNAVKFTSKGTIALKLRRTMHGGSPALRFELSDTGIGIDGSKLKEIFLEFRQADATTTRAFGGSGLGLSICKKLVDAMSGEIGVRSAPGQGSTFWFVVPEMVEDKSASSRPSAA